MLPTFTLALPLLAAPALAAVDTPAGDTTLPGNVVRIVATEYRFDAPDTLPAGLTTFRLVNSGAQYHHYMLVRFDGEHTAADLAKALQTPGPPPAWVHFVGGPNPPTPKGGEANATLVLTPGRYAAICVVPDEKGVPHVAQGMMHDLVVVPSAEARTALPPADVELTLMDYGFKWSKPLTAGRRTIKVTTARGQPHEVFIARLAPGKSLADFMKVIDSSADVAEAKGVGGVAPLEQGEANLITLDLEPGEYVVTCYVPDARDGKPHHAHGMLQQISVK